MWIYIILTTIAISLVGAYEITKKKYWYILASSILAMFSGIRYRVGTDYVTYESMFKASKVQEFKGYEGDVGFLFISKLINEFTDNIRVHFFIVSVFITISFMIYIYLNSNFKTLSVAMYIMLGNYLLAFNIMRQYIAIAIILIAIQYINTDKNLRYYILIVVASLFHTTAIIMLPIKILLEKKWTSKIYIILIGVSVIVLLNMNYIVSLIESDRVSRYADSYYTNVGSNPLGFVVNVSICIFGYIYIRNNEKLKQNKFWKLTFLNMIISLLSLKGLIFARIASYFSVGILIFIPNICNLINKKERKIIIYLIIVCLYAYMVVFLMKQGSLLPYRIK